MISVYLTQPSFCSSFSFKPLLIPFSISKLKPFHHLSKTGKKKKIRTGICRAEFSPDALLAAAIGGSMLSSLLLPVADTREEDGVNSVIDAKDARFAAMGIISFIPYFNWLEYFWYDKSLSWQMWVQGSKLGHGNCPSISKSMIVSESVFPGETAFLGTYLGGDDGFIMFFI